MKEIISKTFNKEKKTTQNYSSKYKKRRFKKQFDRIRNQNILESVFMHEPDAIPLSHTAFMKTEGLKSYLKDSPVCLDLDYYQPINTTEKILS